MTQQAKDLIRSYNEIGLFTDTEVRDCALNDLANTIKALQGVPSVHNIPGLQNEIKKYQALKTEIENEQL